MSLDRTAVIDRLETLIKANTDPVFTVIVGEPISLPAEGNPWCAFWYRGDDEPDEGGMTLGSRMNLERIQVMCFWWRRPELSTLEPLEKEIWAANRNLRTAFWGDYTLNNEATRLDITNGDVDYGFFPLQAGSGTQRLYRTLDFELRITDLEGEAISA